MGKNVQHMKLPIEADRLLQQVKEVSIRKSLRRELKNDLAVIETYESWIREAYKPLVREEEEEDWIIKSQKEYKERLIEKVPEWREKKKEMEERYSTCIEEIKESIQVTN